MLLPASIFVVLALLTALSALRGDVSPLLLTHAFLAAAALPLMFGAILHFVPVLTRSSPPPRSLALVPWLGAAAGLLVLACFAGWLPRHVLMAAALIDGIAALALAVWILGRMRRALGRPHPGASWYPAALALLLLALLAVFGMLLDSSHYGFWRRLHQHLNLFGWIGLTVLGTLPVLLPTALRAQDPGAALRLRRELRLALPAAPALALGAALGWPWLAAPAALLLIAVIGRHQLAWLRAFGLAKLSAGVAAGLVLASLFLTLLLAAGIAHGFGLLPGSRLLPAFIFGFLLNLITAALAQLLPVWRFSGPQSAARNDFAAGLAAQARGRALVFVVAGLLALAGVDQAGWLVAAALLAFVAAIARHWRRADR